LDKLKKYIWREFREEIERTIEKNKENEELNSLLKEILLLICYRHALSSGPFDRDFVMGDYHQFPLRESLFEYCLSYSSRFEERL
jgi:hypothetical protein